MKKVVQFYVNIIQISKNLPEYILVSKKNYQHLGGKIYGKKPSNRNILDGLSVHTFSGAYSKDTFNDYEILLQEKNALTRFESDVRFWRDSNWIKDLLPTPAVDTENSVGHTEILGIHLTTKTKTGNEYETYFGNETGISSDLKRPLTDISKKTLDELLKLIQPI